MQEEFVNIPVKTIGPIKIIGLEVNDDVQVPLASLETPIWPSTNRGASVTRRCKGVQAVILDDRMTRSILLEAPHILALQQVIEDLPHRQEELREVVKGTSRFCRLLRTSTQVVGNLLFLRIEATTGNAAGHNMVTKAADAVIRWICQQYPFLQYVSISGNTCVDKKTSAINGLLGRGKHVVADILIPREVCQERLKTTPEALVALHVKKNLVGSLVAGSLRTANAHFANLLYAVYLATGQDVANIVEGSQGFTHATLQNGDLYFSVTLPNIIVGTVGNGKQHGFARKHLEQLGCLSDHPDPQHNARRLAIIVAATVLCGELSLLAAQTNPGELMQAHERFERMSEAGIQLESS
jgi:hydroxymethylglutaryl-CoA reductase (NADPH)